MPRTSTFWSTMLLVQVMLINALASPTKLTMPINSPNLCKKVVYTSDIEWFVYGTRWGRQPSCCNCYCQSIAPKLTLTACGRHSLLFTSKWKYFKLFLEICLHEHLLILLNLVMCIVQVNLSHSCLCHTWRALTWTRSRSLNVHSKIGGKPTLCFCLISKTKFAILIVAVDEILAESNIEVNPL